MILNDKFSTGRFGVAELFKKLFSSVYSSKSSIASGCLEKSKMYTVICQQPCIVITVSEMFKALNSLDLNSCPRSDGNLVR